MPRRTWKDRRLALVIGVAAALWMMVRLSGWSVRADVYDPLNRGPAVAIAQPLAERFGEPVAATLWGALIGGAAYGLAPLVRRGDRSDSSGV